MPATLSPASSAPGVVLSERSSSLWVLLGGALTGLLLAAHQLQLQPDLSRQLAGQQPAPASAAPALGRVVHPALAYPIRTAGIATWPVSAL